MFDSKSLPVHRVVLVLACLFLVSVQCSDVAAVSQSQALSALDDAEGSLVSAYGAVSRADAARANASELLVRLNEAGDALARARIAYDSGDYDSSLGLAALCQERLNGSVVDADALAEAAGRASSLDLIVNVAGSIVGSVGVACSSYVLWVHLNRRYGKTGS